MLFLNIYTYEPGKRDEVLKRRLAKGLSLSKGIKLVGEWSDLGGGRGFLIGETDDPKAFLESTRVWNDLMKIEIVPVIETAETLKTAK